jgi:hypothetical protein
VGISRVVKEGAPAGVVYVGVEKSSPPDLSAWWTS